MYADCPECIGASCKGELLCCVQRACLKFGVPPLTYHRAGGAPPQAEAMDGKEEVRVVEEQPAWQGGSLESLDVIDKVPDESVKLATD